MQGRTPIVSAGNEAVPKVPSGKKDEIKRGLYFHIIIPFGYVSFPFHCKPAFLLFLLIACRCANCCKLSQGHAIAIAK